MKNIPMTLTVDDAGINDHPIQMPVMPIGTDIMTSLGDRDNQYYFTITGYDVLLDDRTGKTQRVKVFAEVSEGRGGSLKQLIKFWDKKDSTPA